MQHVTPFLSLLPLAAAFVATASADSSPEVAAQQLSEALGRELAILSSVQDGATAAAAVPQLQAVLGELAAMDRSYEAEKALWTYIDNTDGVKLPLIELLQRLSIQFTRLEESRFYGNAELKTTLTPQLHAPQKEEGQGAAAR